MQTIKAGEFKTHCLRLMDEVSLTGEDIIITKHGKPIAKLVPALDKPSSPFGLHKSNIKIEDDLTEPTNLEWEALS